MSGFSALELARIQFGFTISFHIVFPAIPIGLASYLTVLEACWLRTQDKTCHNLYHFWSKIFAANFGMGGISGLVMAFQFGTNRSFFSDFAGSITGPLLAYEVLTAFFLEAGFLGVMLFGWSHVGPGSHFFSTALVALGTLISATWVLAAKSWVQMPQGFGIVDGRIVPTDWLAVIFNPSVPYRLAHMSVSAFLTTAVFVAAPAVWHLLGGRDNAAIRKMFSMDLWMALFVAPLQAILGDFHGRITPEHQPAKLAAIEGHREKHDRAETPLLGLICKPRKIITRSKFRVYWRSARRDLFQEVALGANIQGFPVMNRAYAGGSMESFSAFPLISPGDIPAGPVPEPTLFTYYDAIEHEPILECRH